MKNCDICNQFTSQNNAYLFDTATVLASDRYIDSVIDTLVKQGKLPSSVISRGINNQMRNFVRNDLKNMYGTTPWIVCQSCLSMFLVNEKSKKRAKERANKEWHTIESTPF